MKWFATSSTTAIPPLNPGRWSAAWHRHSRALATSKCSPPVGKPIYCGGLPISPSPPISPKFANRGRVQARGAANGIDPSADTVGGIQSKAVGDADRGGTPPLRQGASSIPADGPLTGEHYIRWFQEVCQRTCETIVHWMRVGFVHGVMNTDNMSILGLTIDYGPYGWLDNYDPDWTPNTTDAGTRRYRFRSTTRRRAVEPAATRKRHLAVDRRGATVGGGAAGLCR